MDWYWIVFELTFQFGNLVIGSAVFSRPKNNTWRAGERNPMGKVSDSSLKMAFTTPKFWKINYSHRQELQSNVHYPHTLYPYALE